MFISGVTFIYVIDLSKMTFDKGFEYMIYMYIWYQNRERERAVLFDTYIYIYIYRKSDRYRHEIAVGWTVLHPHLEACSRIHSRVASFPGCLHAERCMDKSVRPKMVLVYPNLKTIEMFILKWFGNLRWNKKVPSKMNHPKSHAAKKKNVKSESQELDTRSITRAGRGSQFSKHSNGSSWFFSSSFYRRFFVHGHLGLEVEIFSSVTPKHVWPPFP